LHSCARPTAQGQQTLDQEAFVKLTYRIAIAALALSCAVDALAVPYPTETQFRQAIDAVAGLLQSEGLQVEVLDAQKEGVTLPLMSAGLGLTSGTCLIFYNTKPLNALLPFFDSVAERDLPMWLNAIAVHELTHCVEQREAYVRQRFDKVLPPDFAADNVTVQGYLSMVKSGEVKTWSEALADIAAVLYFKRAVPAQWSQFAQRLAAMRIELASEYPAHDTTAWLYKIIAENAGPAAKQSLFEAAFALRRQYRPDS
jgi:hypothetical protein